MPPYHNTKPDRKSLLGLPEHVRRAIYARAGLTQAHPIDIDRQSHSTHQMQLRTQPRRLQKAQKATRQPVWPSGKLRPARLIDLLLVCHRVHDEALDVYLRTNTFALHAQLARPDMLEPLLSDIPDAHLFRLTRLFVRLNTLPCQCQLDSRITWYCKKCVAQYKGLNYSRQERRSHGRGRKTSEPTIMKAKSRESTRILGAWERCCRRLGSAVPSKQLELTLICDIDPEDDGSLSSRLLSTMARLPLLKSCTIRLGSRSQNGIVESLVRRTGFALTEGDRPAFRFNHLPKELKLHILRFTRLGTSYYSENYRTPSEGLYIQKNKLCPKRQLSYCCGRCSLDILEGCCCPKISASFASDCACVSLPAALFRVSREMRADALETFLRYNGPVTVFDSSKSVKGILKIPTRVPALRHLVLLSPQVQSVPHVTPGVTDDVEFMTKTWKAWGKFIRTLSFLAEYSGLSTLNLELDLQPLSKSIKLLVNGSYAGHEDDYYWVYYIYLKVAEAACAHISGVGSVTFHLGIFSDLAPWLQREVLGERFEGPVERPSGKRLATYIWEACPRFHQMDFSIRRYKESKSRKLRWPGQDSCARAFTKALGRASRG